MTDAQTPLIDDLPPAPQVDFAQQPTAKSNGQQVWDTIVDLSNQERHITRKVLCDATGLKAQIVDDHVERLVLHGKLRRLGYGVLEVVEQFPEPRVISKTVLPDGRVRLEIDDIMLTLTPKEARTVAGLFGAELNTLLEIESSSHFLARMAELANQVQDLRRTVTALRSGSGHPDQLSLEGFRV